MLGLLRSGRWFLSYSPRSTQVHRHEVLALRFQSLSSVTFEGCLHSMARTRQARLVVPPEPFDTIFANAFSACSFSFQPGIKSLPPSYTSRTTASIAAPLSTSTSQSPLTVHRISVPLFGADPENVSRLCGQFPLSPARPATLRWWRTALA